MFTFILSAYFSKTLELFRKVCAPTTTTTTTTTTTFAPIVTILQIS